MTEYVIGLDFGTASARGVLLDAVTGQAVAQHVHAYSHGTLSAALPDGTELPRGWALQVPDDYLEAGVAILDEIGRGRRVLGIGVGFTASSPLPCTTDGTPLNRQYPHEPHAYVKLWKHGASQPQADRLSARGGDWLANFGGRISGEWLLAKAAQISEESPFIWERTGKFIESGDWLVWQLTGVEARSLGFAAYKAQYRAGHGYPAIDIPGLQDRLSRPLVIGSAAGALTADWLSRTGIIGPCAVAVAAIDSHVVLPAVGATGAGTFVAALGTSAVSMLLDDNASALPSGIEGVAHEGALPGLWCYEAGQASFGDMLTWFVETFPKANDLAQSFSIYEAEARGIGPARNRLVALDWWSGNRVPNANSNLGGLLAGLNMQSTAAGIYRALMESLCFGMRLIRDLYLDAGFRIDKVIMTSGLARRNGLLIQIMADVLGCEILIPQIENATAVGAAIHGAVASGLVEDYTAGAARFGARDYRRILPDPDAHAVYDRFYDQYRALSHDPVLLDAMQKLQTLGDEK